MTTDVVCPICRGGVLSRGDGRLEQSGDSYLPTVVWACPRCAYTRYEPAPRAHWQPVHGAATSDAEAQAQAGSRRAA